ncbi:MAG: hypothetical protein LAN36_15670 [Acidobacteriia bacterium]|nr:hypothetical protein [Terriglobia bacterium]
MLLDKRVDFDSFEDWFVRNTWNVHLSGSSAAVELTFAIEEALSEYSSGNLSEARLRNTLSQLIHAENQAVSVLTDAPYGQLFLEGQGNSALVLASARA